MRTCLLLAIGLFCKQLTAQNQDALRGTWQAVEEVQTPAGKIKLRQQVTFYKRNFYRNAEHVDSASSKVENISFVGKYKERSNGVIWFRVKDVLANTSTMIVANSYSASLRWKNDSTILLGDKLYNRQSEEAGGLQPGPDRYLALQKAGKPSDYIRFSPLENITMFVEENVRDTSLVFRQMEIVCKIDSVKRDSVFIRVSRESITEQLRGEAEQFIVNNYRLKHRVIAVNDILYLRLRSQARKLNYNIAKVLMAAGIVAIVSSPLASNVGSGDDAVQNSIVSGGLASMGVAIPFFVLSLPKRYHISRLELSEAKDRYILSQLY